ncbi:hypothetical protein [Antrihabitans cavernicola]|uniref:Uncharacterized protein n=1 Tax=Antrihabitans cavernicola TaxID=2495913 RepID=A0A5A7SFW7_9NOCA|nr:hypothetical protein [Spelaeibacter cavernicola]KAA0023567.1 hypothetical protein FOY51_09235 [Spelaeibacter cavernicola]
MVALVGGNASAAPTWGPLVPQNPFAAPTGTSTSHGDPASSDATPFAGPGSGPVSVRPLPLGAACPTILQGSDGMVVALCTTVIGQIPTVFLLDTQRGPLAALPLAKGSLLGGVYAYLDNLDRLVVVDGNRRLVRVGHHRGHDGTWLLSIDATTDLSRAIPAGDNVTGLAPDTHGTVWFATAASRVGAVTIDGRVGTVDLPAGEQVANSISTAPTGTAVATTHALYQLNMGSDGTPHIDWRRTYDRGTARKPGQLSWGTGSTPTYFGPSTGAEYLTIVDNADAQERLLVYRAATGELVCSQPVLSPGAGSENSPIGIGRSVFVADTYGYPYPTVPDGAGPAVPPTAPFIGGMTRVDVDESGCHTVWQNRVRSAAVPHLSIGDGLLYTAVRNGATVTSPADGFSFVTLDPSTGEVRSRHDLPGTVVDDPIQMSAQITARGEYLQGTVTGIVAVAARR